MSIELLISLIGLATAIIGLLAALTPYLGKVSIIVQRVVAKFTKSKPPPPSVKIWFVNVGEHRGHIRWEDCVLYGCISAGGGLRFAQALKRLKPRDTVYAYITKCGYVGYGKVTRMAVPIDKFIPRMSDTLLVESDLVTSNVNNQPDNIDDTDWVVDVEWIKTFEREQASRNTAHYLPTVCRIKNKDRIASLCKTFGSASL